MLTNRVLSAAEAESWGLVNQVVLRPAHRSYLGTGLNDDRRADSRVWRSEAIAEQVRTLVLRLKWNLRQGRSPAAR